MMKILVIGASGFVGSRVLSEFRKVREVEVEGTYLSKAVKGLHKLDITNEDETRKLILKMKPDAIVHTAALTNVEYCEEHHEEAFNINVNGTRNIVNAAKEVKSKVVFVSTEYVFDGKGGPYSEEDSPNPLNYYGKTKVEGERIVSKVTHVIIRTTVIYGWDAESKNFMMQVFKKLTAGDEMKVAMDQYGSPTFVDNLAQAIVELTREKKNGIYNIVGRDVLNRYEFAVKIAQTFNLNQRLLKPMKTSDLNQKAPRPKKSGLRIEKASRELKTKLLAVDEGLKLSRLQMENEQRGKN